jgi:DEAD/DEAH box helicase domain-containing protein
MLFRLSKLSLTSDRLLLATSDADDAVRLLQAAAKAYIPVNPSASFLEKKGLAPAQLNDRTAIAAVIAEAREQVWYKGQIVESRIIDPAESQTG